MYKKLAAAFLLVAMVFVIGCSTHVHTIGKGAQSTDVIESRQWYFLYGLVPINDVDTNAMAGDAADYEITTQYGIIDILISAVTSSIIHTRTVSVRK